MVSINAGLSLLYYVLQKQSCYRGLSAAQSKDSKPAAVNDHDKTLVVPSPDARPGTSNGLCWVILRVSIHLASAFVCSSFCVLLSKE